MINRLTRGVLRVILHMMIPKERARAKDIWLDGRTRDPAARRAANECLRAWEAEHDEQLTAVSSTGRGTVFESQSWLVMARTSKTKSLKRNPGYVLFSDVSPKQFSELKSRAKTSKKKLLLLLMSLDADTTLYFEIPGELVSHAHLPKKGNGVAYLKVFREDQRYRLETTGAPIDLSDFERRLEYRRPGSMPISPQSGYAGLITIDPRVRSGKPCIRGMRITVQDVLEYMAGGMTEGEILEDFPELTAEDIRACLAFAADRERRLRSIPV